MFHRIPARSFVTTRLTAAIALTAAVASASASYDDTANDATLFRVFLTNGTSVTSYGEYARVGDRVVFSMPLSDRDADPPVLHLVNLPASLVDWPQTERYADSARYTHYVQTRGDADYAALNNEISSVLAEIAAAREPGRRLELALGARRALVEWPSAHFGYRSHDVAQMSAILDEIISELRAATGGTAFDLSFVATVSPPELQPQAAPASERELFEQAMAVAELTDAPAERMSLLEAISASLSPASGASALESWRVDMRTSVAAELAAERKVDAAYMAAAAEFVRAATRYAKRADVAGVQRVLNNVPRADQRLGGRRPDQIRALVQTIEAELQNAQRLRLALDHWELRLPALRKYADVTADLLQAFDAARWKIEQIQRLAGPSDALLARLVRTCEGLASSLRALTPPGELVSAHSLVLSAVDLASTAGRLRREAIRSQNLETARDASSAAAGALMLMARARADIDRSLQPPK